MDKHEQLVRRLLKVAGTTYAAEAGIKVSDKPMPLFQLLVLCMLASKPIDAATAMRGKTGCSCATRQFAPGRRACQGITGRRRAPAGGRLTRR
jgi:hypothetical protein